MTTTPQSKSNTKLNTKSDTGHHLAIDVGGTFIDFIYFDAETQNIKVEKVPSSGSLEERFFEGIEQLEANLSDIEMIVHGSTQVINTIVQENGAKVGLITTKGFKDVLELARGNRPEVYNLFYQQPTPLVPRYLRCEVTERLDYQGNVLQTLDKSELKKAILDLKEQGVEGIAICFLHAYVNPVHEQQAAALARELCPELQVSASSEIVREFREFERTSTTVLNAYTQPRMSGYLGRLELGLSSRNYQGSFAVMQSSGGITSSQVAQQAPIRTIQSGPAGGVIGTAELAKQLGIENVVAADVGGTTFDVALITGGDLLTRTHTTFNKRPVLQTTIDIVSVGAGGGSIAHINEEGGLQVGPQSAQADPGPACFGLGGTDATVTDAQVILGYLDPKHYLGERMKLDVEAAKTAIMKHVAMPLNLSLEDAAAGILHLTNMNMAYAIRQVTIERGHDPRDFSLVSYGGGGGLFAATLLKELDMKQVVIPHYPATFSAYGLLYADYREDIARTFVSPFADMSPAALGLRFLELEQEAKDWFASQGLENDSLKLEHFAELRYLGQEHNLIIPVEKTDVLAADLSTLRNRFDAYYDKAYAHSLKDHELEFVGLRLSASLVSSKPTIDKLKQANTPVEDAIIRHQHVYLDSNTHATKEAKSYPVYDRKKLQASHSITGPAIIEEWNSTVILLAGQKLKVDEYGNLIMEAL